MSKRDIEGLLEVSIFEEELNELLETLNDELFIDGRIDIEHFEIGVTGSNSFFASLDKDAWKSQFKHGRR